MLSKPEPACLLIADISGYTGYLAGAELDHAQDVLADLIDTLVTSLRPTFRLAKLEGDAAFCYVIANRLDATIVQDTVEHSSFTFRRRLRDIANATSCECNACTRIPALGLKFVVHHGAIVFQRIAGSEELAGTDVIVVHRLLKNRVVDTTGLDAYALYTQAAIDAMGVTDPASSGLVRYADHYDAIGEVVGWVRDLDAAWAAEQERSRVYVSGADAMLTVAMDLPAPPPIAWEWVTSPARRPLWQSGVLEVRNDAADGRMAVGTRNHCVHGKDASVEEILDWRPYDYMTDRSTLPQRGLPRILATTEFTPIDGGTRVEMRFATPTSLKDRLLMKAVGKAIEGTLRRGMARLVELVEADVAERTAAGAGHGPEPVIEPSAARYAREPLPGPIMYLGEGGVASAVDSGAARSSSG